jgi:hypothetical protein
MRPRGPNPPEGSFSEPAYLAYLGVPLSKADAPFDACSDEGRGSATHSSSRQTQAQAQGASMFQLPDLLGIAGAGAVAGFAKTMVRRDGVRVVRSHLSIAS